MGLVYFTIWCIYLTLWLYLGASKNRGTPKRMVYKRKPIRIDDLGVPLFLETPILETPIYC